MDFFYRLTVFFKSLMFHLSRGMPKSSQKEIDYRFDICGRCESFDKQNSQCMQCGCNLSRKKVFLNKLAWKDQQCPLGKW